MQIGLKAELTQVKPAPSQNGYVLPKLIGKTLLFLTSHEKY